MESSVAPPDPLNGRIAARVRALRAEAGLSLEALASRSGVSRSMLSLIERGESSATAVVLERVATALGRPLADLFQPAEAPVRTALDGSVARRAAQVAWTDPASGYRRRALTPPAADDRLQLVEVTFPPGASLAYETGPRVDPVHQQVWMIEGRMHIRVGDDTHDLLAGDCLAHVLDRPMGFHNPGPGPARYLVALMRDGRPGTDTTNR